MSLHHVAPTQFVEVNGIRFAFRRFGTTGGVPSVFNMHFVGIVDHWDPAITDGLARGWEVILFNKDAVTFIRALGLLTVDVLGFSLGGLVAQEVALADPKLIRRLVLVGTAPRIFSISRRHF